MTASTGAEPPVFFAAVEAAKWPLIASLRGRLTRQCAQGTICSPEESLLDRDALASPFTTK
jgi:hypothetical protein